MIEIFDRCFRDDLDKAVAVWLKCAIDLGAHPKEFEQQLTASYRRVMLDRATFSKIKPRQKPRLEARS